MNNEYGMPDHIIIVDISSVLDGCLEVYIFFDDALVEILPGKICGQPISLNEDTVISTELQYRDFSDYEVSNLIKSYT
jgi:hypothetical protein